MGAGCPSTPSLSTLAGVQEEEATPSAESFFMSLWHVQLSDCVAWGWKVPGSNPSSAIYWLRDPGE